MFTGFFVSKLNTLLFGNKKGYFVGFFLLAVVFFQAGYINSLERNQITLPLQVSGFPATAFMAIAFFILLNKKEHDFIWKSWQYNSARLILRTRKKDLL